MSAERGWIGDPQPTAERRKHSVEVWAEHHRLKGHHPHPAPTKENPEQWECKCDPDAPWTAIWRILTINQIRQKFAHLRTPTRLTNPDHLVPSSSPSGPPLTLAPHYASGRPRHRRTARYA